MKEIDIFFVYYADDSQSSLLYIYYVCTYLDIFNHIYSFIDPVIIVTYLLFGEYRWNICWE